MGFCETTVFNCSDLKTIAGDKINLTENLKLILERLENIVGNGENGFSLSLLISLGF